MKINNGPRGTLIVDDARIIFRNFAGVQTKFNREGDRNFALVIETVDDANALIESGWNVKTKPPRDEDDTPLMFLPVKIKFNDRGPKVYLKTGDRFVELSEDTIDTLDNIDILSVDMDLRPYDWDMPSGLKGRTAYLDGITVHQQVDRFRARYED
jgi:hypothetical protein